MHFKALELIGFKSFAEKTKLNFEPGVTAIVGPNGCGKSNIADSIRWVLGEQSTKSLRASKMEDVIFNGTDNKEPINFAEVSLTLSNEKRILPIDYDEVTISRRVFRSGENEYLLNKTPVRLKDISELLMGTGIGAESYSIIEQGKMDLVLSSKPEDRRYVFEEASGITKYKSKKREALRKLEQTEQNLLRINDIIQEVKRQITSIERQARKAERYKEDFEKLKDMEVRISCLEYKDLKTGERTHALESQDLREREKDYSADIAAINAKIADYRQALEEVNKKIFALRDRRSSLSGAVDMNAHKMEIDRERIEESRSSECTLTKEVEGLREKISQEEASAAGLKAEFERVASERTARQASLEEKDRTLKDLNRDIEESEEKLKVCKVSTVDHLARETRIKNELIKLGADVQNRKVRERRLNIEKETVQKDLEAVGRISEAIGIEFEEARKRVADLRSDLETKTKVSEALASELKCAEEAIAKEENRKTAIRSKIEFLEDLVNRFEGFKSGVKNLLVKMREERSSFGGLHGVLADLIKVERGYEEAVSTFLGEDAQLIVAEKDDDIKNAIGYLKESNSGKATFISLQTLGRMRKDRALPDVSPGAVPFEKFIKVDERFGALVDYFFGGAYLTESLDDAIKPDVVSGQFALVTKSGLMFKNGKISGGSAAERDESLLIGRKDRLEALKREAVSAEESVAALTGSVLDKRSRFAALESELRSIGDRAHAEEITLSNIKVRKDAQEESVRKFNDELSVVDLELDEVRQAVDELTTKGEALNKELNDTEAEMSRAQLFAEESQVLISDKRSKREQLILEMATLRTETQSYDREEESARINAERSESFLAELKATLSAREGLLRDAGAKIISLEEEIASLGAQNGTMVNDLRLLDDESAVVERSRSEAVDKMSIDELQLKEKESELEAMRNQARDLDVKLTEINYKKTNLRERIQQAYKTDLETVHAEPEETIDRDALRAQVSELKERLDRMGPVNLVAIEEHKELEERHSFLVHQQEDLVNAKESLLKAIQKINKTTRELFMDAFQKIRVEFKNFFRLLFGGGQAELVLIDEQDVLESGIEIIVRPPGKKLQNIMLLSGGEKALTAIALLFSIFKVKPSPFCVLDEIDAPLDESNVLRFSNVLKDFLKISQFIIITHNKRTIELADVMYGITMQERGVSKIVSVKLLDEKKRAKEGESVGAPS
ncbi:MAG: chromosome segregation protein SMC [Candidatus Omnitrophota bacterium]